MKLYYLILLFIFINSFLITGQNESKIDLLKNQIENKPIKSLKTIDKLLSQKELVSTLESAKLLNYKGDILKYEQNIYKAIDNYLLSYNLYKKLNNLQQQITLLNKISALYIIIEKYSKVIDNQNIIEKLLENTNSNKLLSSKHIANMALMYFKTDDLIKAKKYLIKAINIATYKNDEELLNNHFKDLSRVFLKTNQLDSALYYSIRALDFSYKNKNHQLTIALLINKGEIFEKLEDYINSEKQYFKAIRLADKIGANSADIYTKLGNFYKRIYLYDFAHKNLRKAIPKIVEAGDNKKTLSLYSDLMENSILRKRTKTALYYFNKYNALSKIIEKEEKIRNIDYINERYNMQKEEIIYLSNKHTLKEKESELLLQKESAKKNKIIYLNLIALISLILLAGFIYYRFYKLKNEKANIQLKNTVLRLQMNPHFIFNSLTVMQNAVLKNKPLKSAELIANFSKLIRQNLDYSSRKHISLTEEINMLTNYLKTQQFRFEKLFLYEINIDENIDCDSINIPPMLIQPFIENAIEHGIKHKKNGGLIKVLINRIENDIKISIIDNGVGFKNSKKYNETDANLNEIHAIGIFKNRLRIRQKNEEKSFKVFNLTDVNNKVLGSKVVFTLKNV